MMIPLLAAALVPWEHPSLEMYRAGVTGTADRARIELCVRPKEGVREGAVSVGFPRHRAAGGRWRDGVIAGVERSRTLHASADHGPACFSILVPPDAAAVEIPLGPRTLEIAVADLLEPPAAVSDVDGDPPAALSARPDALAVVFGVETYAKHPAASFAAADARTAARYFEKVLGIPEARIELLLDGEATLGQMHRIFGADGWLARRISPESEVFVFFAGHGMAETEKFSPYLLPSDGDVDYLRQTALSLDEMIGMLASLGPRRTTLFLDACFSGLSREGDSLLDGARPLLVEEAPRVPTGLSVFSAGSRGQIVSSLDEKRHGLFSYFLFKGIAGEADLDQDRRVLASELKTYLDEAVPKAAAASLDREQTPGIALADPGQVLVHLP